MLAAHRPKALANKGDNLSHLEDVSSNAERHELVEPRYQKNEISLTEMMNSVFGQLTSSMDSSIGHSIST